MCVVGTGHGYVKEPNASDPETGKAFPGPGSGELAKPFSGLCNDVDSVQKVLVAASSSQVFTA